VGRGVPERGRNAALVFRSRKVGSPAVDLGTVLGDALGVGVLGWRGAQSARRTPRLGPEGDDSLQKSAPVDEQVVQFSLVLFNLNKILHKTVIFIGNY